MNEKNPDGKFDDMLNSFDGMQRAQPAPYLGTRLMAKINARGETSPWQQLAIFLGRPVIVMIGLVLIIGINLWVSHSNSSASSAAGYDFAINVSSNYDLENPENPETP